MLKFSGGGIVAGTSRAREVESGNEIPPTADVVIIGGGILGSLTALMLAERGVTVALCEKGAVGGEASGRSGGAISYKFSPVKMPSLLRAMRLWDEMTERVDQDIGYCRRGLVSLYETPEQAASDMGWLEQVRGMPGVNARMLPGSAVPSLDPALDARWHSALLQENAASVEPRLAAPAIAEAAIRLGASIVQNCAVTDIILDKGRIAGVKTEQGQIRTGNVVIASGVWSPRLMRHLGLYMPQLMVFAEMMSVAPVSDGPTIYGGTKDGYFRREPDGGYMMATASGVIPVTPTLIAHARHLMSIDVEQNMALALNLGTFIRETSLADHSPFKRMSAYQRHRVLQPDVRGKAAAKTYDGLCKAVPAFRGSVIRERYAGAITISLDNMGTISSVNTVPGLFVSSGMMNGLTLSPALAEALADLIIGQVPQFDLSPYRYERFTDGSKLQFHL